MARKIFSWENFPYGFIKAIVYGKETSKKLQPAVEYKELDFLIPYMNQICSYPDDQFVRKYRGTIEDYFLNGSNHLLQVVKNLEKLHYSDVKAGENEDMMFALRQKKMTQTLCDAYMKELHKTGITAFDADESMFQVPKTLDLTTAETAEILLYPYQEEAVKAMREYYIKNARQSAILSMPTGSGKTRTSVYYLLHDMISAGYQVLWLCHRAMLIEQAAEQFYSFAPLIRETNNKMKTFKMVCISGKHANVRALQEDDNLIIASVQSLCNNTIYLPNILSEKVIIVVDEAHHALAPSYRRIIKAVRAKRPDAKLLGLTATPVRLTDRATGMLMKIFDDKIVYSVAMSKLIMDGTLSKPNYILRETNVDIEAIIEIDERQYIRKWGELPESLIEKVAKTNERNDIIVDEYIKNKDKYGKTIIFALNAIHCDTLNKMFKSKGIKSDYVYTMISDAKNRKTIERFRHNDGKDGIDVLININMLTEGSDIPDIQTVFLTRPTTSDVLLMQMVGRGMRGAGCGGTETVNIVDFCDKWSNITIWLDPRFITGGEGPEDPPTPPPPPGPGSLIPIDAIRDIVKGITYKGGYAVNRHSSLPVGWYDVIDDEDGNDAKILVFENQMEGYQKFEGEFEQYIANNNVSGHDLLIKYFKTFGAIPSENELDNILSHIRHEETFPEFHKFELREQIEPFAIAEKIKKEKETLTYAAVEKLIEITFEQNRKLILNLYGSKDYYRKRINDYLMFPKGIVPIGTQIEDVEKEVYQLSAEPFADSIEELLTEVIDEQREHFPADFERPEIYWTDKPKKSYFGIFYHDNNLIYINSLLNSASVPKETLKFIIYHECLHQEFYGHPWEFREKERRYPDFQKQENFLYYTLRDFDLEKAM